MDSTNYEIIEPKLPKCKQNVKPEFFFLEEGDIELNIVEMMRSALLKEDENEFCELTSYMMKMTGSL